MFATRSDGVSIDELLAHGIDTDARHVPAGWRQCVDPACPSWQQHVDRTDSFWWHVHPAP